MPHHVGALLATPFRCATMCINHRSPLAVVFLAVASVTGCGSARDRDINEPINRKALGVEPNRVDFGIVDLTASAVRELNSKVVVRNRLSKPVCLLSMKKHCNCTTTALVLPRTVAPGETITVPVRLRLAEQRSGPFAQTMTLYTDESGEAAYHITLHGIAKVKELASSSPSLIDFGTFGTWILPNSEVRLSHPFGDIEVIAISGTGNGLNCNTRRRGRDGALIMTVAVEAELANGSFDRIIQFETNHGPATVLVRGTKADGIIIDPSAIMFLGTMRKSICIKYNPHVDCALSRITSDIGDIEWEKKDLCAPGEITADIRLVAGAAPSFLRGLLRVEARLGGDVPVSASIPMYIDTRKKRRDGS